MPPIRFLLAHVCVLLMAPLCMAQSIEQLPDRDSEPAKGTKQVDASLATAAELDLDAAAERIVELTDQFRSEQGLQPATTAPALRKAASEFAAYMAKTQKYGHTADGRRPSERAAAAGYEYCIVLENIAYRYQSRNLASVNLAEHFFEGWKNSPEHRKNMLDPAVTETGVALAAGEDQKTVFAVQMFGRPKSAQLAITITNQAESTTELRVGSGEGARTFELPPQGQLTMQRCRPTELSLVDGNESSDPIKVSTAATLEIRANGAAPKTLVRTDEAAVETTSSSTH